MVSTVISRGETLPHNPMPAGVMALPRRGDVRVMNHGLDQLPELPPSLRLVREIHAELLRTGRGAANQPGEFRRSQNWFGPEGLSLRDAAFIPSAPDAMATALGDLETFRHAVHGLPPLFECALAHAHFETIHPSLDGNARVGRPRRLAPLLPHRRARDCRGGGRHRPGHR